MQRARSMTWGPAVVAGLGLALVGAWIAGVLALTGKGGYETSLPLLLGPVLVLVSLPALARQAQREESSALFWLLVAALVLKLLSSVVREYVAFDLYETGGDAGRYHQDGIALSQRFRDGNFETGLDSLTSTNFIRVLTGVIYTIIGPSRLGGFLVYSWLGFWGLFFFYRAFTRAVPAGRPRTYARTLFFLPSLLFWPSGIGKEAWMTFALGVAAYGAARLLTGSTFRGILGVGLGLCLAAVVRPHVAAMIALALAASYTLRRPKAELRELAPLAKVLSLGVLTMVAVLLLSKTAQFLENSGIDTTAGVTSVLGQVGLRTSSGGSEFEPASIVARPLRAPVGIVTVLFRPFPFEAQNAQSLMSALEGVFLLLLSLTRIRWALTAVRNSRRQPYVLFALVFVGLFVVAFSGVANFGLLARQRVQVLPLYLVLFSIPRRETEMPELEGARSAARGTERVQRDLLGARPRPTRRVSVPTDVAATEQLGELQTRVSQLEAGLRELQGRATVHAYPRKNGDFLEDKQPTDIVL